MPRLQHASHEAFAREYAKDAVKDKKVIGKKVYKRVYANVTDNTAIVNASRLLANANVQNRIQEIITLKNPVEKIAESLAELISAKKEVITAEGGIIELKDNPTRLGAVNLWMKVMGGFGHEGDVIDARSVHYNTGVQDNSKVERVFDKLSAISASMLKLEENPQTTA